MELEDWRAQNRFSPPFSTGDIMSTYLAWCQNRNLSAQTLRSYGSTLGALADWLNGRSLDEPSTAELEEFLLRKRTRRGRNRVGSPATRRREVSCLRAFWAWAVANGHATTNPADGLVGPRVNNRNPRPIPDDVWIYVWGQDLTDSERVMLGLGFFCGLRRYELASLQAAQVTNTRLVNFTRKGGGEHTLPWREMVGVYEDWMPELLDGDEHTLSTPLKRLSGRDGALLSWLPAGDPQVLNKRLYRLLDRCGVPTKDWFTPHQLRHSAATNLLRAGVPLHMVASLLNHTSPTITMRYVQAGGDQLREWRKTHG